MTLAQGALTTVLPDPLPAHGYPVFTPQKFIFSFQAEGNKDPQQHGSEKLLGQEKRQRCRPFIQEEAQFLL